MSGTADTKAPSLENKVLALMQALRSHGGDDWAGKPSNPDDDAYVTELLNGTATAAVANTLESETAVVVPAVAAAAAPAEASSLDALMSVYMGHIQSLRSLDGKAQADNGHTGGDVSAMTADGDVDFAALLQQLDELPPLKR